MNTNQESTILLKDEVYRIVSEAIEVLNEVGHGFHDKHPKLECERIVL